MPQLTDSQLTDLSNTVQNETVAGANTATRIGELFNDLTDSKINNDKISTDMGADSGSNSKVPSVAAVETYVAANSGALPYKIYVATLSQSSTSAPSANILQNTLTGTPVWSRTGTGSYVVTLNGAFTADKTVCFVNTSINDTQLQAYRATDNTVRLDQQNLSNVAIDGLYGNCIEIRVYN